MIIFSADAVARAVEDEITDDAARARSAVIRHTARRVAEETRQANFAVVAAGIVLAILYVDRSGEGDENGIKIGMSV